MLLGRLVPWQSMVSRAVLSPTTCLLHHLQPLTQHATPKIREFVPKGEWGEEGLGHYDPLSSHEIDGSRMRMNRNCMGFTFQRARPVS